MSSKYSRRTRIYDANYRLGEESYKDQLNYLNRKQPFCREKSEPGNGLKFKSDFDLEDARCRASRAITEEGIFDSRGCKLLSTDLSSTFKNSDERDEEKSLKNVKKIVEKTRFLTDNTSNDVDDATFNTSLNFNSSVKSFNRPALKIISSADRAIDQSNFAKWTNIETAVKSSSDNLELSKKRVSETKLRLRELEEDMESRQERQLARDRRIAYLKNLVNDPL
jgi:hypothetical protein